MRKVAVIGANGQVGAELCLLLARQAGFALVPVCRTRSGSAFLRAHGIPVRHGSVADPARTRDLIGDCDVIVNSALATGTPRQIRATEDAIVRNLVSAAGRGALVVHFSTQSVYGDPRPGRWIRWRNPYGRAKRGTERTALRAAARSGARLYILRLGHVGGPLQGISEQIRNSVASGEVMLPGRDVASNLVYTVAIVDAIVRIARGGATPGVYDLMNTPQMSWREVYEVERQMAGLPAPRIVLAPVVAEVPLARRLWRNTARMVVGAGARNALTKLLAHAPQAVNARATAWWHRQRARSEIAALERTATPAEHLSWVANGSRFLDDLTPTQTLLAQRPYSALLDTGRRPWPEDLPPGASSDRSAAGDMLSPAT